MPVKKTLGHWLAGLIGFLSIDRAAIPHGMRHTLVLAALLGTLYGILVTPFWSEAVEFGQTWAGIVDNSHSPWGAMVYGTPSLQIVVPALLLKAGFGAWPLSLLASGFCTALAFSAIAATAYVFMRHVAMSLLTAVILLTYTFAQSHGYPVMYPIDYFQFGQTGQYFGLLALALAAYNAPRAAGIVGGIMAGVHAVWCGAFAMGALPVAALFMRASFKRLLVSFIIAAALTVGVQHIGQSMLPTPPAYQAPAIPETARIKEDALRGQIQEDLRQAPSELLKRRGTFTGHNVLFAQSANPVQAALTYAMTTAVFLLLVFYAWQAQKRFAAFGDAWPSVSRLLMMAAIPVMLTLGYKTMEQLDPDLTLLGMIHPKLPGLFMRAIIDRWLNLTSLLVPVLTIALLFVTARNRQSRPAAAMLAVLLCVGLTSWFITPGPSEYTWRVGTIIIGALALLGIIVLSACRFGLKPRATGSWQRDWLAWVMVIFFVHTGIHTIKDMNSHRYYTGSDAIDPLVEVAGTDKGQLILGSGVVSLNRFNPQLRIARPIVTPMLLDVYDKRHNKVVAVFCFTDLHMPPVDFYASIKPCFENRSPAEWAVIFREVPATGIITPAAWALKIPAAISAGGFTYYRAP